MQISNLTPQEYFRLHSDKIPTEIQNMFENLENQVQYLEVENKGLNHNLELAEEQISFARNLVEEIDRLLDKIYPRLR